MALTIRQFDSLDAPGLQSAWERLSAACPRAGIFNTYDWCRCWAETVGARTKPAVLLLEDGPGRAVGLLPGCLEKVGAARWLKFMGRDGVSGDHLDLLCLPGTHEDCLRLVLEHLRQSGVADGLVLGELERDSPTVALVGSWAAKQACPLREREPQVVPYVDLPCSFDAYLSGLSPNMRYHVRRRCRAVSKVPGAAIRLLREAEEVDQTLTALFELHERRWRREGLPGNFGNPGKRDFLRRFCRAACQHGWVRAHVLEIDGRPPRKRGDVGRYEVDGRRDVGRYAQTAGTETGRYAQTAGTPCGGQAPTGRYEGNGRAAAVLLAFHWNATASPVGWVERSETHHRNAIASFYQMGWDPDCPVQSPGVILLAESIRQAIAERMHRYDFLRGDEAYKWKWTTQFVEQTTLVVGWSAAARAALAAQDLKDGCKRAIRRTVGQQNWERMKRLVKAAR